MHGIVRSALERPIRLATSARSLNLNAFAERWIGSVRRDATVSLYVFSMHEPLGGEWEGWNPVCASASTGRFIALASPVNDDWNAVATTHRAAAKRKYQR